MLKAVQIKKQDRVNKFYKLDEFNFFVRSNVKELIDALFNTVHSELIPSFEEQYQRYSHDKIDNTYLVVYQNVNTTILTICSTNCNYYALLTMLRKLASCNNNHDELYLINDFMNNYDAHTTKLSDVQTLLDETKDQLVLSIDKLNKRGESIEDLVYKTNELSNSSKIFVNSSKKLNKCCIII
jgi:synaptobrevin family protein YKT6